MNIKSYFEKKYGKNICAISKIEAEAFGIPFPLKKGWLFIHGETQITDYMKEKLGNIDKYKKAVINYGKKIPKYSNKKIISIDQEIKQKTDLSNSENFYKTNAWKYLRMQVLIKYKATCQCCGASKKTGAIIHVDHIKPRSKFPLLALDFDNLQVLCADCNVGKLNIDQTDWRGI